MSRESEWRSAAQVDVRYLLDDSSINSTEVNFFFFFYQPRVQPTFCRTHTYTHSRMQLHLMLAHNLPAVLKPSAILPGQVMKSTQGQVTKILSVASAREGSSVLTDGHSIPGPWALPAHCQEVD